jgi:hypothetical protein
MSFDKFDFTFDADAMKRDLDRVDAKPGQARKSNKYFRFPDGECVVHARILPAFKGGKTLALPYASTRLHYINGRAYHCLRQLDADSYWRGDCPICTYYNALYRKADAAKTIEEAAEIKDIARQFKPIERHYYNVIVREIVDTSTNEVRKNVGPLIIALGKSLQAKVLRAFIGDAKFKEPALGNVANPYTGRDFKIIKELVRDGNKTYPRYDASRFEEESVLGADEQVESWLGNLWDLEAERNDELKTIEELQEQIDIIQGKLPDPNVGFDVQDYSLPKNFNNATGNVSLPSPAPEPESVVAKATETKKEEPSVPDVPFDLNLDSADGIEMDADWVKDLQAAVSNAD